jgi:hypothetical protein
MFKAVVYPEFSDGSWFSSFDEKFPTPEEARTFGESKKDQPSDFVEVVVIFPDEKEAINV